MPTSVRYENHEHDENCPTGHLISILAVDNEWAAEEVSRRLEAVRISLAAALHHARAHRISFNQEEADWRPEAQRAMTRSE